MSKQSLEWTKHIAYSTHISIMEGNREICFLDWEGDVDKIIVAHNTALAAAYKRGGDFARKCCAEEENEDLIRLEQQLAAETERHRKALRGWEKANEQLSAERDKVTTLLDRAVIVEQQLVAERKQTKIAEDAFVMSHNFLLQAQAAIAEHNATRYRGEYYPIVIDQSLLEAHDAEVRKPLLDALNGVENVADILTSELLMGQHFHAAKKSQLIQKTCNDALAKVKEGTTK